ncbi:M48 family metalloprotease [Methylobacterium sp. J-067]|uniref:M48 family metalloprotease n=1 Tax=Methylobacterium sp. J-067 TaxID=2836648 RepID=UPI001FBA3BDD|nr:M48 family metalloprotease [Methylobacterium sp. J-067]MCJ2025986.1 M48 family metalloprotease [Methylobacterium sp. J-067]
MHGRDPTRSLIQASGTSFLLSLVLGDLTGSTIIIGLGNALLSAGYSREAERAADTFAVNLMTRAGGNAAALAEILERIAEDEKGGLSEALAILRSHPLTRERAAAIRAQASPGALGRAILSGDEWTALQGICASEMPARHPR